MGDVTRLAPESLREHELASPLSTLHYTALHCTELICSALPSRVPIHHLSGISQGAVRNVHSCENKKKRKKAGWGAIEKKQQNPISPDVDRILKSPRSHHVRKYAKECVAPWDNKCYAWSILKRNAKSKI